MTAPATNRVLAHTGARYPIIQAPMGWIARTQLASAVSRAGGLGIIETSSGETANCQAEITKMSALGLPFGVNLPIRFLKDDAMLRFVCASGVKFVTTSAGSPAKFIAPLKDAASRTPKRSPPWCCCRPFARRWTFRWWQPVASATGAAWLLRLHWGPRPCRWARVL